MMLSHPNLTSGVIGLFVAATAVAMIAAAMALSAVSLSAAPLVATAGIGLISGAAISRYGLFKSSEAVTDDSNSDEKAWDANLVTSAQLLLA